MKLWTLDIHKQPTARYCRSKSCWDVTAVTLFALKSEFLVFEVLCFFIVYVTEIMMKMMVVVVVGFLRWPCCLLLLVVLVIFLLFLSLLLFS